MTDETPRLALPLIAAGQAQKELFHNEALTRIDALVHGAVAGPPQDAPPATPMAGEAWIVGVTPTAAWSGHAGAVAWWSEGGWRFAEAREGMALWVRSTGSWAVRDAGGWTVGRLTGASLVIGGTAVVGARRAAIADPGGGTTVDGEARAALGAVLAALRGHGLIAT